MDRSSSWVNAGRDADYVPPSRVARMAVPSPRPPPGSTAEAVATARRAEHSVGGSILPVLPSASPNASKRSSWTTPRSPIDSLDDEFHHSSNETFAPPPRRAEMASMAAARRPEPVRQRSISDGLFASETEQAQLAYMEQMYGTINLLNAELESERRSRAALEAARPATYPAMPDYSSYEEDVQIPVGEFDEPPSRFIVSQTPVAPSYSPRKLRTMPSPPSQPPQTQHRVARPPVSPRSITKDQDDDLCATLGKNAELRIRSRDMERTVEKTELELELARKQLKMSERRAESREEKLRALLKEKLSWQKEIKATRAQVVEEKMRQVDLFREVEAAKRHFAAELEAVDQDLRAAQEENSQLRTHAAEMKAQLNFQARKMEDIARQAQEEKARFVAMIEDTRHRFREWKEDEAAAMEAAHEQVVRNLKTEFDLKTERHQDEKQKLRDKVNDLEVSMRLLQKDRTLSPLELSLRKVAILGSKDNTGIIEAEQIETQSRILELENLLARSLEYQSRQESIIKLSEATVSRLMQEREVTALENLSLHPFGLVPQRTEDLSYEAQLTGYVTAPSSPVRRMSPPGTPPRGYQNVVKTNELPVVRSPKSRSHTPRRADLEASIADAARASELDSKPNQPASTDEAGPSSREQSLMEELAQLRKALAEAQTKAADLSPSNSDLAGGNHDMPEVKEVVSGGSSDIEMLLAEANTTAVDTSESACVQDDSETTVVSLQNEEVTEQKTERGGEETPEAEDHKNAEADDSQSAHHPTDQVPCEPSLLPEERSSQNAEEERHSDSLVNGHVVSADEIDATRPTNAEIEQPDETILNESEPRETSTESEYEGNLTAAPAETACDENDLKDSNNLAEIATDASSIEASELLGESVATGAALEDGDDSEQTETDSNESETTLRDDPPLENLLSDSETTGIAPEGSEEASVAGEAGCLQVLHLEDTEPTEVVRHPQDDEVHFNPVRNDEIPALACEIELDEAVAVTSQCVNVGDIEDGASFDTVEQQDFASVVVDNPLGVLDSQVESTSTITEHTKADEAVAQALDLGSCAGKSVLVVAGDTDEAPSCEANETITVSRDDASNESDTTEITCDDVVSSDVGELVNASDTANAEGGEPPVDDMGVAPYASEAQELEEIAYAEEGENVHPSDEPSCGTGVNEPQKSVIERNMVEAEQLEDGELSSSVVNESDEIFCDLTSEELIPTPVADDTRISALLPLGTCESATDELNALDETEALDNPTVAKEVIGEFLVRYIEGPAECAAVDVMEVDELPVDLLPEVSSSSDERAEGEVGITSIKSSDIDRIGVVSHDCSVGEDKVASSLDDLISTDASVEMADTPAEEGEKASEFVMSENDELSQAQKEVESLKDGADRTQIVEYPSPESKEVIASASIKAVEAFVAEALAAAVEALVSWRQENSSDPSEAVGEAAEEPSSSVSEDNIVPPAEAINSRFGLEPLTFGVAGDENVTCITDCSGSVDYKQDIDYFIDTEPDDANKDARELVTAGEEQQVASDELPTTEGWIEDIAAENNETVSVLTKAVAEKFVKDTMVMFDVTSPNSENQEGDETVADENSTTEPGEDVCFSASSIPTEGGEELVLQEPAVESCVIPSSSYANESVTEASTTNSNVGSHTAEGVNSSAPCEELLRELSGSAPEVDDDQPIKQDAVELAVESNEVDEISVEHSLDENSTPSAPDALIDPVPDATDDFLPVTEALSVARNFVNAVETRALSLVLLSMQNDGCVADNEHENESDSTRSIIESCNLSSEEQDELSVIDGESELPPEYAVGESTSESVDSCTLVEDADNNISEDVVHEATQAHAEQSHSPDEVGDTVLAADISGAAHLCVETIEREILTALVCAMDQSLNDTDSAQAHQIAEPTAPKSSEFSTQEIVSDVACHFSSQAIAEVLDRLSQSCVTSEDEHDTIVTENGPAIIEDIDLLSVKESSTIDKAAAEAFTTSTIDKTGELLEVVVAVENNEVNDDKFPLMETTSTTEYANDEVNQVETTSEEDTAEGTNRNVNFVVENADNIEAEVLAPGHGPIDDILAVDVSVSEVLVEAQPEELVVADDQEIGLVPVLVVGEAQVLDVSGVPEAGENLLRGVDDQLVELMLAEMIEKIAAGEATEVALSVNLGANEENVLSTCISVQSDHFPGEVILHADTLRTAEGAQTYCGDASAAMESVQVCGIDPISDVVNEEQIIVASPPSEGIDDPQPVLIDEFPTTIDWGDTSPQETISFINDSRSADFTMTSIEASTYTKDLPPTADGVGIDSDNASTVESAMMGILAAVETFCQDEGFKNTNTSPVADNEVDCNLSGVAVESSYATTCASLAATASDESTDVVVEATEDKALVLTTEAETSESLGTNDERPEATDKQSDIEPCAETPVDLSFDEEAAICLTLESLVDAVAVGNEIKPTMTNITGTPHGKDLCSDDDGKAAELSTDLVDNPLELEDEFGASHSAFELAVESEVKNAVGDLCASVEHTSAPKHTGRARSVHFASNPKTEKTDRLGQMRRSVLLWQAPVGTACSKEAVESSVKRRASKRRTSRRTLADLLAFPTEMARFTSSDTTLLAYDARHEQGEIFSLLDQSILTINPHGRHIHLDDQDDRVGSRIIGKRKTLMQELHSKNLALRQIPRFNYMPMRINFQWSDFVVATPVRPSNSNIGEGHISKSPVEPMRLLQKRGAKLPCGTYVVVSAFVRPLEDGNENLRVQIYDAERVEEFQFDFSEDIMKKYHLASTGLEAQSLEFLGHLEFRRDEDTIIIKLPEKKAGDGSKVEGDRLQSERIMVGGGDPRKREPKQSRISAYRQKRPASSPAVTSSQESSEVSSCELSSTKSEVEFQGGEVPLDEPSDVEPSR